MADAGVGARRACEAMIEGGLVSDLIGIGTAVALFFVQKVFRPDPDATIQVRGAD